MFHHLSVLLQIFWRPASAMGAILDRGSLLFASAAMLVVSLSAQFTVTPKVIAWSVDTAAQSQVSKAPLPEDEQATPVPLPRVAALVSFSFYTPLLLLAVFYVPGTLVLASWIGALGSVGAVVRRDYSSLLTCVAMAWTAAALPVIAVALVVPAPAVLVAAGAACLYFLVLVFFAVRTVLGTGNGTTAGVVALSWLPLLVAAPLTAVLGAMLGWLTSPLLLLYAYYYLGSELRGLGAGLRSRMHLRRMLEAAAVNPHDSDAQLQLGLLYQQRRQYTEAIARFKKAITIDRGETDAHFQLGRIAREQGRLAEAKASFETVLEQDPRHSSHEILRDAGELYLTLGDVENAGRLLSAYTDQRPYDPEGLYYYGQVLAARGNAEEAREIYDRAIEAARTAPRYRQHITAKWSRLAQKAARKLPD